MKKLLAVSLTIMILGTLGGCGKQDTQEPPKVEIDYGNSELYTQEEWLNGLEMKEQTEPFTQCILFSSSFHSPVEQRDAWDADTEYEGWQWWLGRSDGGAWELVTCGYG